jgi:hypothetical protein
MPFRTPEGLTTVKLRYAKTAMMVIFAPQGSSGQGVLQNGTFETADFSNWTLFTTPNGSFGFPLRSPAVTMFDIGGDSTGSLSANLCVGQAASSGFSDFQGGGLRQIFSLPVEADLTCSVDVAVENAIPGGNFSAGVFYLILDGIVLDSWNAGTIEGFETKRQTLFGVLPSAALGDHEFELKVLRNYPADHALTQYFDNANVSVIPEPETAQLFVCCLIVLSFVLASCPTRFQDLRRYAPISGASGFTSGPK